MSNALTELLAAWRAHYDAMTPEQQAELERQARRGYVIAEMSFGSDADEAAYAEALSTGDAEALARLDGVVMGIPTMWKDIALAFDAVAPPAWMFIALAALMALRFVLDGSIGAFGSALGAAYFGGWLAAARGSIFADGGAES